VPRGKQRLSSGSVRDGEKTKRLIPRGAVRSRDHESSTAYWPAGYAVALDVMATTRPHRDPTRREGGAAVHSRKRTAVAARDSPDAGRPSASSAVVRKRMQATPRRDTPAELRIRRALHVRGLRYSVDAKPLPNSPRRADIVFRRARVAVFVDGCFWHGCPLHASWPKTNASFWRDKINVNRRRDEDTNLRLRDAGWLVIRAWEHDRPEIVAVRITRAVRLRTKRVSSAGSESKSVRLAHN
jgi:DNA mismatch endonuclease (patch repair protein)